VKLTVAVTDLEEKMISLVNFLIVNYQLKIRDSGLIYRAVCGYYFEIRLIFQ